MIEKKILRKVGEQIERNSVYCRGTINGLKRNQSVAGKKGMIDRKSVY